MPSSKRGVSDLKLENRSEGDSAKATDRELDNIFERVERNVTERAKREAEHAAKPLPDLSPSTCLVAFIDILGFRHEIEAAKTKEDLESAYRRVRLVQEEFQMESAVVDPEEQAEMNRNYGRRVIALSDAVVVVISPNCEAGAHMGGYDHLGFAVYELILAQTLCAVRHGIFVRGGLSHGSFFFENDVLLSPALARAYDLESNHAEYPVIAVPHATKQAILGTQKKRFYAKDADPTTAYFAEYNDKRWREEPLYYLDYAGVMVNEDHRGWLPEDRADYLDAREKGDKERAQAALNRRALKDSAFFSALASEENRGCISRV
jgi:hypothetical protein